MELIRRMFERNKGQRFFGINSALAYFKGESNVHINPTSNLPNVYTEDQIFGLPPFGIRSIIFQLLDGGKDHAGENAHFVISVGIDSEYQYIDIEDDGPGIINLANLRAELKNGRGSHYGSSLDMACTGVKSLGGAIIPSNIIDNIGNVIGARFRIQLPLERSKMNTEFSRHLRESQ